ncbi:MAG: DUF1015 domain-containing protein [Chloroflexi bacterium]|nr:DUF1015 domain-containing protein [Chloroflexota bacterium]MYE42322.1 DUF1015 domain-containing protein [Chloroflexota bacterium]
MAKVTPFRGWRYNPAAVDDMAAVLCPPYDLITPQIQQALMDRHPLNVIHLEAGEGLDWSADPAGRYAETSERFEEWMRDGVLRQDAEPGYYLLRHGFTLGGLERSRLGLIACVGLEDYETRQVLPHEFTEAPAIRDRVTLMESVSANISPIMSIYRDAGNELEPVFQRVMAGTPEVDARDEYDTVTTMWRIANDEDIAAIAGFFERRPVFLADGHHRYEASRQYQIARHAEGADAPSKAHNFVMMTLISFDDPGLVVLPYHRNLSGLSDEQLARVNSRILEVFDAEPAGNRSAAEVVELVEERGRTGRVMAALTPDGAQLLTLRPSAIADDWGAMAVSEAWVLEEKILRPELGNRTLEHLGFLHDHEEAAAGVANGSLQMAFLMKPFPMDAFEDIVGQGQRLPRKSTFFYPKLPTGLVINRIDGEI